MGQSDIDQIYKIFDIMGLPNEEDWPVNSVIPLKSFSSNSNLSNNGDILKKIIPNIDDTGLDLLRKLLDFNMNNRISARNALNHFYFTQFEAESKENTIPETINKMKNTEENDLASLPDITNVFQPNILKRKRIINNSQKS